MCIFEAPMVFPCHPPHLHLPLLPPPTVRTTGELVPGNFEKVP